MIQQRQFDFSQEPMQAAFDKFHVANPRVYAWLRAQALRLKRGGRDHYSARTLLHAFRFHTALETTDDVFRVNNNHSPFYGRLLMEQEPELAGFFETRAAVADA